MPASTLAEHATVWLGSICVVAGALCYWKGLPGVYSARMWALLVRHAHASRAQLLPGRLAVVHHETALLSDCAAGHLNNAVFATYADFARAKLLMAAGLWGLGRHVVATSAYAFLAMVPPFAGVAVTASLVGVDERKWFYVLFEYRGTRTGALHALALQRVVIKAPSGASVRPLAALEEAGHAAPPSLAAAAAAYGPMLDGLVAAMGRDGGEGGALK
jgi:hypothetical protein